MDQVTAAFLLENLLDRVEQDAVSGKWRLGTLSSKEKAALELALVALGGVASGSSAPSAPVDHAPTLAEAPSAAPVAHPVPVEPVATPVAATDPEPSVAFELNLQSLGISKPESPEVTLCLDFGTAMSKAFGMKGEGKPVELSLGNRAGGSGYPVDSSLFISDEGLIFFGPQAVILGTNAAEAGRTRFDSPKARLSMGAQGEISKIKVGPEINPITGTPLTEEDLITLYLGYLTDLAGAEMQAQGYSRYTRRRFARPCWPEERNRWAEPLLRRMLARAQILADTFHGRWQAGIPVGEANAALVKLRELAALPEYLLAEGVPEPVAAAASLMLRDEAQREMFLVIDVGAGTTDFGLFMLQHNPEKDVSLARTIPGSIEYLPQAGNRVDDLLKFYVLDLEGIDPATPEGRHNLTFLQSTIRQSKETLFRDGIVEIPLANHTQVVVDLGTFRASERIKAFAKQMEQKLASVLAMVGEGYLDLMAQDDVYVVLTGGGAGLPMVLDLAKGVIEVKGRKILRKPSATVPAWIDEGYPQMAPQYPQLAVAIGGAAPDLPTMGESFADFKGLGSRTYV